MIDAAHGSARPRLLRVFGRTAAGAALAIIVVLAVACGGDSTSGGAGATRSAPAPSPAPSCAASSQVCADVMALQQSVDQLRNTPVSKDSLPMISDNLKQI